MEPLMSEALARGAGHVAHSDLRTAWGEAEGELWLLKQQDPAEAGDVGAPSPGREEEGLPGRPLLW